MIFGCAGIKTVTSPPRICPAPDKPMYRELDVKEHIGSAKNLETLLLNLSDMAAYISRLENTVECYGYRSN
jgi:hypothetical protein